MLEILYLLLVEVRDFCLSIESSALGNQTVQPTDCPRVLIGSSRS